MLEILGDLVGYWIKLAAIIFIIFVFYKGAEGAK